MSSVPRSSTSIVGQWWSLRVENRPYHVRATFLYRLEESVRFFWITWLKGRNWICILSMANWQELPTRNITLEINLKLSRTRLHPTAAPRMCSLSLTFLPFFLLQTPFDSNTFVLLLLYFQFFHFESSFFEFVWDDLLNSMESELIFRREKAQLFIILWSSNALFFLNISKSLDSELHLPLFVVRIPTTRDPSNGVHRHEGGGG